MWLFYYFNFESNYKVLKSKSPCILFNKNIKFNKNETESKVENTTHSLGKYMFQINDKGTRTKSVISSTNLLRHIKLSIKAY